MTDDLPPCKWCKTPAIQPDLVDGFMTCCPDEVCIAVFSSTSFSRYSQDRADDEWRRMQEGKDD